jgi:glycosyltransferase involved in cell wall biosynthesis
MSFRACLVIPVYNHGDAIGATIATLRVHGLPLYLVDDGSDAATARQLDILTVDDESTLLRLPRNGQRCYGHARFACGLGRGFTHVARIDVDGQHDAGDIPGSSHAR